MISILSPTDDRWMAYLSANQLANVFHHPAWSYLLAESYAYEPFVLAASNSQGDIQSAIISSVWFRCLSPTIALL
jgi:hypothetical protein